MTTIRPVGIDSPSKKNPSGVLHVAYARGGLYFGGLVTGPASHPGRWHIVTLVSSAPPFSRPDAEVIAISPETYADLVRAETSGFWPAFNDHVYALQGRWENKVREWGGRTVEIPTPEWLAEEILASAARVAYATIWAEESEGAPGRCPSTGDALLEARMEAYLKDCAQGA